MAKLPDDLVEKYERMDVEAGRPFGTSRKLAQEMWDALDETGSIIPSYAWDTYDEWKDIDVTEAREVLNKLLLKRLN